MMGSRAGDEEGRSSFKLVRVLPPRNTMLFGYLRAEGCEGSMKYRLDLDRCPYSVRPYKYSKNKG